MVTPSASSTSALPLRELKEPPLGTTLISDGSRIYAVDSPGVVVDLISKGQGVFAIAVDKVWTDLEGSLAKPVKKRGRKAASAGGA